jgi:hypothetical protein
MHTETEAVKAIYLRVERLMSLQIKVEDGFDGEL